MTCGIFVIFSGTPFSSTNKTDCHDTTEILLKVALNTIAQTIHNYKCLRLNLAVVSSFDIFSFACVPSIGTSSGDVGEGGRGFMARFFSIFFCRSSSICSTSECSSCNSWSVSMTPCVRH